MSNSLEDIEDVFESALEELESVDMETKDLETHRRGLKIGIFTGLPAIIMMALSLFEGPFQRFLTNAIKQVSPIGQAVLVGILVVGMIAVSTMLCLASFEVRRRRKKLTIAARRISDARTQFKRLSKRVKQLEQLWDHRVHQILSDERRIWVRRPTQIPEIKPLAERRTPFVSFLNLKGGVGKTFLAANSAVLLEHLNFTDKRILLFDLDFQGTLSEGSISPVELAQQNKHSSNVRQLWEMEQLTADRLNQLTVGMTGSAKIDICPADNPLDEADFRAQTQHLLLERENRFNFRQLLHHDWLYLDYGLVLFDCPPRLTASTINALAASDYIVIPTRLEAHSARAVPNTLTQILALKKAGVINARILGVVPNEVSRYGISLVKSHQNAYSQLMSNLEAYLPSAALFPEASCAEEIPANLLPKTDDFDKVASFESDVRDRLKPVGEELARRLKADVAYDLSLL